MSIFDKIRNLFSSKREQEEQENVEQDFDLDALRDKYQALLHNSISVKIRGLAKDGDLTHFGGLPSTPKDFKWPYYETDYFNDGIVKERPLAFLAQFDCSEFTEFDKDNLLPHTGVLAFFYSVESECWGFDTKDEGCSRVYWFENVNELTPTEFPCDLEEDSRFPSLAIKLSVADSYPDYENLPTDYDSDEYEEFFEALHGEDDEAFDDEDDFEDGEENISKLLGWADTIQSAMERECELIASNYYLGDDWSKIPQEVLDEAERTAPDKWQLLFQLDSVNFEDFELEFFDSGRLYFWIRKEDLAARRFDRVWLIVQCY